MYSVIEVEDIEIGTKLVCLHSNVVPFKMGDVCVVTNTKNSSTWPYRLENDAGGGIFSLRELNGIRTPWGQAKFVLECEMAKKELFTLRVTGKLPERYID